MSPTHSPADRLHAVQRLQEMELDQARAERTRLEKVVEQQRERMADLEARLDQGRTLEVTSMVSATGVSVEALRRIQTYLHAQAQEILQQQEVLSKAQAAADDALLNVLGNFERLSATRRLRERRATEASVQQLRVRFKEIDDMAIVTKRNPVSRS